MVHLVTLLAAAAILAVANRGQWFFGDEWDFLTDRGLRDSTYGLWEPHNEHWSTWPILIYRLLYTGFGVTTYWPYVLTLIAIHLLTVHLAWRIARRAGASELAAAATALIFAVHGAGSENLLWAFQIGFIGSLGVAFALILLVDRRPLSVRRAAVAGGVGIMGLPVSGISVLAVVAGALVAWRRGGWRLAAVVSAPPALVYVGWLRLFGGSSVDSEYSAGLGSVPSYAWRGLSGTMSALVDTGWLGGPLIVGLAAFGGWLAYRRLDATLPALVPAATAVVLFVVVGSGRGALAVPTSSRYLYLTIGLLTPLMAVTLTALARPARSTRLIPLVVLIIVAAAGIDRLGRDARDHKERELAVKRQLGAALELARSGDPILATMPDSTFSPNLTIGELEAMDRRGELPGFGALGPTDRLSAAAHLQVAVAAPSRPLAPGELLASGNVVITPGDAEGCIDVRASSAAQLAVGYRERLAVRVQRRGGGEFAVFLQERPAGMIGVPRILRVEENDFVLRIAAADATVAIVSVPPGPMTICGIVAR